MAVSATNLVTSGNNADQNSYTTASITPPANQLILAWIENSDATGTGVDTVSLSGNGLTWVNIGTVVRGIRRLTLFRAMGASPTAGAVTISAGADTNGCAWSIVAFDGVETSGTNGSDAVVQALTNNGGAATSGSVTLAAFASVNNATAGGFIHVANEGSTPGTGFTEIGDTQLSTPVVGLATEYRADNDTSVDMSWTTSSAWAGIAVEIKAGGPADTALVIADASHSHTAENVSLTQVNTLVINDGIHAHTADSPSLTQANILSINDASHAHTADSPTVTQTTDLVIANSAHSHTAENVSLTQANTLAISNATHSHTAENLALVQAYVLVIADSSHTHTAENLTFNTDMILVIADSTHAHTAESLTLTLHYILTTRLRVTQEENVSLTVSKIDSEITANAIDVTTLTVRKPANTSLLIRATDDSLLDAQQPSNISLRVTQVEDNMVITL